MDPPGSIADQLAEHCARAKDAAVQQFLHDRHMSRGIRVSKDVAQAVIFLVSLRAQFTGAAIDIEGTILGLI